MSNSTARVPIYVSLGSNIDPEANTRKGVRELARLFGELKLSRVYRSRAVGFEGDDFFNMVIGLECRLPATKVMEQLRIIETNCGRERGAEKFAARTLDLDLLTYGDAILDDQNLDVPRKEIEHYAFVLAPLAELAGDSKYPRTGETYADMWQRFDGDLAGLAPIDFDWEDLIPDNPSLPPLPKPQ